MAGITGYGNAAWLLGQQADAFPDKTLSQRKWDAYIQGVDSVEEEIRRQVELDGQKNFQTAEEDRERKLEAWQQEWEKFVVFSKVAMEKVKDAAESDSGLFLEPEQILQEAASASANKLKVESGQTEKTMEGKWAPYEELSQDGGSTITYNGITFMCDKENHTISLGDVTNPRDVIQIPLSGGGTLLVNKHRIGDLGRAISMFSPEDIGNILRAIAEYKKAESMENEMEEEEIKTLDKVARHEGETENKTEDISDSTGIMRNEDKREEKH